MYLVAVGCDCQVPECAMEICPTREQVENLLKTAGAPVDPVAIGIDRELFRQSLLQGYTVRPRYSIMQYAKDQGRLEMIAEKITADIYD